MNESTPIQLVEGLLKILRGTSIAELEVESAGIKVRLHREVPSELVAHAASGQAALAESPAAGEGSAVVTSAYVGTFHHSPEDHLPDVGDEVAAGTKIAEIEVLGIRNSVVAPVDGVLSALVVEDEAPVEYGQPVAVIHPSGSGPLPLDGGG